MEQRGGELAAFLEWAAATLAVCTAPPGSVDHASLSFAGAGSRDGEEPARPASVASAAAASFAQQQAAGMGDGDSGMGSIASRAFLAAGVMQVGGDGTLLSHGPSTSAAAAATQALVDIAKHGHRGVLVGAGLADVFSRVVAIANASGRSGPSAAGVCEASDECVSAWVWDRLIACGLYDDLLEMTWLPRPRPPVRPPCVAAARRRRGRGRRCRRGAAAHVDWRLVAGRRPRPPCVAHPAQARRQAGVAHGPRVPATQGRRVEVRSKAKATSGDSTAIIRVEWRGEGSWRCDISAAPLSFLAA